MTFLDELVDDQSNVPMRDTGVGVVRRVGGPILSVDVGNVYTRAALFDVVNGRYRFVAIGEHHTTDGPPYNDIFTGVRRVVEQITEATGRGDY